MSRAQLPICTQRHLCEQMPRFELELQPYQGCVIADYTTTAFKYSRSDSNRQCLTSWVWDFKSHAFQPISPLEHFNNFYLLYISLFYYVYPFHYLRPYKLELVNDSSDKVALNYLNYYFRNPHQHVQVLLEPYQ